MFKILYPTQDSTIYEKYPERNTGIDQILELTKHAEGEYAPDIDSIFTQWETTYNSRILLKFPIPSNIDIDKCYLRLISTEATSLPINYTIIAHPLIESWSNGNGNYNDYPQITNGVSWKYKSSLLTNDMWSLASASFWTSVTGGGSWNDTYIATQSFDYESADIRMDVTDIVRLWVSGTIENHGFILKHTNDAESNSEIYGSIKFFSKDTHTIYLPKLEIYTNNPEYTSSYSSSTTPINGNFILYISNLRDYNASEKTRLRIHARDRYPVKTYATSSVYLQDKLLPETTYFKIIDHETEQEFIPYDTIGTKINTDEQGHFIDLDFSNFLPERYYRLQFKVSTEFEDIIIDNGFFFRINR